MEYDLSAVKYELVAILKDGSKLHLTDVCEKLGWEEPEKEFSSRLNITLRNIPYGGSQLAEHIPLCTVLYLYADWNGTPIEMWRGTVWTWGFSGNASDSIQLTGYDLLYYLHKSQADKYFSKGTGTQKMIQAIFSDWKIQMGRYEGPNEKHKKTLLKGKAIAAMITEILGAAEDLGSAKCFARAREDVVDILPFGSNEDVFMLTGDNIIGMDDSFSIVEMVTRVRVTGKEDSKGRPKVQATLDGKTEYGILQVLQTRGGEDSLAAAKKKAQKILKERGDPKRKTNIRAYDMPAIRKGDKVFVEYGTLKGFFHVLSISHDATARTMNMEVEPI